MRKILSIVLLSCACLSTQAQVSIITSIAGTDSAGYCCDGEIATNAKLNYPNQLCLDNFGNLYIADPINNRIRKIILSTGIISTVAGIGTHGYNGDSIQATDAQLWLPEGICTDSIGNIYIADGYNNRIRKVSVSTGIISTIAGTGITGNSGDGLPATAALINVPQGLTIDKHGNIYFCDVRNNKIKKINTIGIISTVAGNGTMGYSGNGGLATNAQLNEPGDVGIDDAGNIFFSEEFNNCVRKVNVASGIITTIAGNGTAGYSGNGGPSTSALLSDPYGIFIDKQNNIFIVEGGNGIVRKIDAATGIINTVVGCGTLGFLGDGGPATTAELQPGDVFIDNYETMYIADEKNNRIRKVYNPKLSISNTQRGIMQIYPNPAKDELTIEYAVGSEMRLFNLFGQEMLCTKIISNKESVNIQNLKAGTFIVQIIAANGEVQIKRVVKE